MANEKNLHVGHRERVRNKIMSGGMKNMPPHEILEYMLFPFIPMKDTNELAHSLINEFGSLAGVFDATYERLVKINGISKSGALYLSIIPEIARKYNESRLEARPCLNNIEKTVHYIKSFMDNLTREEVHVIALDNYLRVIARTAIHTGVVNQSTVYLRDVVDAALKHNACYVMLVHNHPSGNAMPSRDDEEVTKLIAITMSMIGLPLIDHIIVGGDDCYSFKRDGNLDAFVEKSTVVIADGKVTDCIGKEIN